MENLVSQTVSKESLNVLAAIALLKIYYEGEKRAKTKPLCNMDDALSVAYLVAQDEGNLDFADPDKGRPGDPAHRVFADGFANGVEFGLAAAAAIVTHGFDIEAATADIRAELRSPDRYWPGKSKEAA